ncbi:MAG: protoheme IX farnesyltransferase [Ignavibacteria bacterium]|nr:MAG: protoheme IX farnesyltransferase [Ignavibacteria bacterium]KAF0159708.1 MAG: protoheme IX farnesyltransferase [Ignavibacteria bacterium]
MLEYVRKYWTIFLELGKVRITFFVSLTTALGYILFSGRIDLGIILPTLGIFLIAAGSSCINHFQEQKFDAVMERTKNRPIPSGRIDSLSVMLLGVNVALAGSVVLYYSSNLESLFLSWLAVFWYNLFYTPLKRKFALAVVPGALIGSIPPIVGWTAAGGNPLDMKILIIALFFFIWQVPHFWLLLLLHNKDYEKAGFPTLTKLFSSLQVSRITFVWIAALAFSCLLIPLTNISSKPYTPVLLFLLALWLIFESRGILSAYIEKVMLRKAFLRINIFVLLVVLLISFDKLIFIEF